MCLLQLFIVWILTELYTNIYKRDTHTYRIFFWLVVCVKITSHRQQGYLEMAPPFTVYMSLVKDVKLGKYTVPTGN